MDSSNFTSDFTGLNFTLFKQALLNIKRQAARGNASQDWFLESSNDVEILSKSEDSDSSTHPCGPSLHDDEFLTNFSFVCSGVLVLIVGSLGLMCNGLTCLTLKMMSKSMTLFNKLLLTLAIVDSCFILSGGALMTKHSFGYDSDVYNRLFPHLIYPMAGMSMTGSTYLCVAIAAERYLGICHRNSQLHRKFRYYLLGILVLTICIESPRFFEVEVHYDKDGSHSLEFAKYRWSADYVTYYCTWFRLFATAVIPLIALSYFNWKVFKYYRDNNFTNAHHVMKKVVVVPSSAILESENRNLIEQVNDATNGRNSVGPLNNLGNQVSVVTGSQNKQTNVYRVGSNNIPAQKTISRERTLFLILCCITITFFICHSPRITINVYEFIIQDRIVRCSEDFNAPWNLPRWGNFLNEISNILLVVNSSANFVYYCLLAESFRKQIANLLLKYCKCLRQYLPSRYQQNSQTSPYPGPKIQLNEMPLQTRQSLLDGVAVNGQDMNDIAEDENSPVLQVIVQAEPEPKNNQRMSNV